MRQRNRKEWIGILMAWEHARFFQDDGASEAAVNRSIKSARHSITLVMYLTTSQLVYYVCTAVLLCCSTACA